MNYILKWEKDSNYIYSVHNEKNTQHIVYKLEENYSSLLKRAEIQLVLDGYKFALRKEIKTMNIILYSTNCVQCRMLEGKMKLAGMKYDKVNDISIMEEKGFLSVPVLEVDGKYMNYKKAFNYVSSL